ncbi:polyphosphate kinase [Parasphingopyxis algicola]|uniref:polyphosphate kinase 2 family protein n=1 Tax=Parasphingopyxis algicola TaxID=2026624 RepID=UPI0015A38F17|nr:polyphosphate kinase [Parasphingopyxis algicola]QLC24132.1 polyphosphate kinase [Parasphingopyxis algicola]
MAINLADYETGAEFDGDYDETLVALQERLGQIQAAYIANDRRAVIAIEGWDASGKGGAIRRLTGRWDPRFFEVWPIGAPTAEAKARHFLWRFWNKLPGDREINIFDRTWYGRVLVERVEGYCSESEWRRGYDEINEFEAQQKESGTPIIKLFMHVTQEEQDERFRKRLDNPWKRWKLTEDDFRNRAKRKDYLEAIQDMFARTDTRWAPWAAIDGNDKKAARIAALTHVADRLAENVSMDPPEPHQKIVDLAASHLGTEPED